jgi:LmbE family N-acetylglucosaminyl deacetylase
MRVLAIGAHPDDIEIYCAGTLAKHVSRGDECFFLVLTDGSRGGDVKTRKTEARESAKLLGAKRVIFAGFEDTKLRFEQNLVNCIRKVIDDVKPDRVYTHSTTDYHQDHRAAAEASIVAAKDVDEILMYEGSVSSEFCPDYFVDITDSIDKKKEAIFRFESQNSKDFSNLDYIWNFARYNGLRANFRLRYAESFKIYRMIRTNGNV